MDIAKLADISIFRNNGRSPVTAECVVAIMHYGLEIVGHISTVDTNVTVFVKSKSIVYEKRKIDK